MPASAAGIAQSDLMSAVGADIGKVGLGKAMAHGWITVDKSGGKPVIKRKVQAITDHVQANLKKIGEGKKNAKPAASCSGRVICRLLLFCATCEEHGISCLMSVLIC